MDTSATGSAGGPGVPEVRRARLAVAAVFAVHGTVTGNFATRVPWLQEHLDISAGALGLALAFPAIGSSVAMPLAGRISHRFGARAALRGLLALWCASLALPPLSPGLVWLCGALFVYGAASGMADVAMNALGVEIEERLGRSIMSGLHGMWSVGALLGSAAGTVAAHTGTDARLHLGAAAAALTALGMVVCRWVPDLRSPPDEHPPPRFALPPRSALAIGAVGFCAVFAEGASLDWSAVYLREVLGSSPGVAAACTTAFACTMAAARLAGDAVVGRLGPVRTVRAGGVLATLGGLVVVTAPGAAVAVGGFAFIGLGIAVVVPLAFAAAGRAKRDGGTPGRRLGKQRDGGTPGRRLGEERDGGTPGRRLGEERDGGTPGRRLGKQRDGEPRGSAGGPAPSQSIAGVATITYTSGLIAPAAMGSLADLTSLTVSFVLVTGLALGLVPGAAVLRRGTGPRGRGDRSEEAGDFGGRRSVPRA